MSSKTLSKSDLYQFTGSEVWYRHSLVKNLCYTDGVRYVAQTGGAYWLIDEIAFAQAEPLVQAEEFQFWKLSVNGDRSCVLTCDDGNGNVVFKKEIEYTDFPLDKITFYLTNQVLLLPSEY